jgi:hypothetical protein
MSQQQLARTAGILYLVLAIAGGFSQLVAREGVLVRGDAAATADHIRGSATLIQIGFATDVVNIVCFVVVALLLHALLSPVRGRIATSFVMFNALAAAIMGVSLAGHGGALLVATDPAFGAALGADGANALALLLMELHARGYLVAEVFFGLWLLPLGYVVYRSGMLPRAFGAALMIGSVGYLTSFALTVASPGFESALSLYFAIPAGIAEVAFLLWLIFRGVSAPRPSVADRSTFSRQHTEGAPA